MPVIGNSETTTVQFSNSAGPFEPAQITVHYQGPGLPQVTITSPGFGFGVMDARLTHIGIGSYTFTVPAQTISGVWVYDYEGLDVSGNTVGVGLGSFAFTASPFAIQATGWPYPYGFILRRNDDVQAIRDALGFSTPELPDVMIGEPDFLPAAETWVMRQVPDWQLIIGLTPPPAPTLTTSGIGSLIPANYFGRLCARVGNTVSMPGPETGPITVSSGGLALALPLVPGITGYDCYLGVTPGILYRQDTLGILQPGASAIIGQFAMTGQPLQQAAAGDQMALKSAVISTTASMLCKRFQRFAPAMIRTLTYTEEFRHDWRVEQDRHLQDAKVALGSISSRIVTPPSAMKVAKPVQVPTDPHYIFGSDPLALPNNNSRDR